MELKVKISKLLQGKGNHCIINSRGKMELEREKIQSKKFNELATAQTLGEKIVLFNGEAKWNQN
jgi:hypothetical protein